MVRHATGVKDLAGTTPVKLWSVTVGRKAKLVKIMIHNPDTADHKVELGSYDGTVFTPLLPPIPVLAGQTVTLSEGDIPAATVATQDASSVMYWAARLEAAVTSNNVQIAAEVEEE